MNPNTNKTLFEWFSRCADREKAAFLAWLSHDLTVHGRAFGLDLTADDAIAAFKGLNELQHKISQNIGHLAGGTNSRSAEHIWSVLCETAKHYGLAAHLYQSLGRLGTHRGLV
jgi:hypothetical protein